MLKLFVVLLAVVGAFAQNTNFGQELANINFKNVIGGPLLATIDAQAQAALTTINFINAVAFAKDAQGNQYISTVDFRYTQVSNGTVSNFSMSIPFLTLIPIPYVQFDQILVEFNVKLNSVESYSKDSSLAVNVNGGGSFGWGFGRVSVNVNVSYKQKTSSSVEVQREYSLKVLVNASQASMPKGTQRILDILDSVVRDGIPA